jgi:hypothetical protein
MSILIFGILKEDLKGTSFYIINVSLNIVLYRLGEVKNWKYILNVYDEFP